MTGGAELHFKGICSTVFVKMSNIGKFCEITQNVDTDDSGRGWKQTHDPLIVSPDTNN